MRSRILLTATRRNKTTVVQMENATINSCTALEFRIDQQKTPRQRERPLAASEVFFSSPRSSMAAYKITHSFLGIFLLIII